MLYALWAAGGWCGTPWPGWWRGPHPHPDPEPWIIARIAGIIGGILGGWLTQQIVGGPETAAATVIATTFGAFVFGRVLSDIAGAAFGGAAKGLTARE
jgi:uncharacterized membrane protein YeaQ/YmgE (transglycosylase-associated protein family)